jgi:hypothetical protein
MKYMVILQDGSVIGMCCGEIKFALYDGDISIRFIDHQGAMREIYNGRQLINGTFEKQDNA